jgi:hypothetical protein
MSRPRQPFATLPVRTRRAHRFGSRRRRKRYTFRTRFNRWVRHSTNVQMAHLWLGLSMAIMVLPLVLLVKAV